MAKNNASPTVILCLILVSTSMPASECFQKPAPVVREEDVELIKCRVCQKVVKQLYSQVQDKKAQISPKEITAVEIIQIAENTCNVEKEEADCIRKTDVVEQGDESKLGDQVNRRDSECHCQTIERACREVMEWLEILNKPNHQHDGTVHFLCENLTEACSSKPPPVPEDRTPGEAFMPKPPKEADVEKNAPSMEGMPGAPGMNTHPTDESMNTKNPREEDKDTHFPSKTGDWKLMGSFRAAGKGVKTHRKILARSEKLVDKRLKEKFRDWQVRTLMPEYQTATLEA